MNAYNFYPKKKSLFGGFSATTSLILINVAVFIIFSILTSVGILSFDSIALKPSDFLHGKYLWTILTNMFMHANLTHLFFNMFSLFFIGTFLERIIGRKRFLWFYLISGIFAGLFFAFLSGFFGTTILGAKIFGTPDISGVGASGALFGLLGVLVILVPYSKVFLIVGPLIAIILDVISQQFLSSSIQSVFSIFINIYFFISIFAIFSFNPKLRRFALPVEMPFWFLPIAAIVPLVLIGLFVALPIGNTAHLGGLIAGLCYGLYLKIKYKKKTSYLRSAFR